jgi:hypothetical protein
MRLEYPALKRAVREQQNLINRAVERSGSQETRRWRKPDLSESNGSSYRLPRGKGGFLESRGGDGTLQSG